MQVSIYTFEVTRYRYTRTIFGDNSYEEKYKKCRFNEYNRSDLLKMIRGDFL
jgi:hypothetical protein